MSGAMAGAAVQPDASAGMATRVVRGSLWTLGGQGVALLAAFVATPFVIRLLGAEQYGVLSLINVLIGYLAFADMGMGMASTRFGGEAFARHDRRGEAAVVWTSLLLALVPAALVSGSLMLIAAPLVEHALKLPASLQTAATLALRIAALGFVFRVIAGVMNTPQLVRLRMDWNALVTSGCLTAQVLLVPLVLVAGAGLVGAVSVIAGMALVSALLQALIARRLLPRLARPQITRPLIKPLAGFGAGLVTSSLASTLLVHAEKFFVARFASVSSLAYYSVAFNLAGMLTVLPIAMANATFPAFSRLQAETDREPLRRLYTRMLRGNLLWTAPLGMLLCVIARPFLTLWAGPDYGRESVLPFYILVAGLMFSIVAYVPYLLLMACGRSDVVARLHLAELLPYLGGAAILTYSYGAVGAAIAWSLRVLIDTSLLVWLARRHSGFPASPFAAQPRSYWLALGILFTPMPLVLNGWSPLLIACSALVALSGYAAIVWKRVLTLEEQQWLQAMMRWRAAGILSQRV